MLQNLRDNSRGIISFFLIGALVVIFALAGVEQLFNWDPTADRVVSVNGESVTRQALANAIVRQKQEMMRRYGDQIPAEFLTDEYLKEPVLKNLIRRELLTQAARSGGMAVSQDAINSQITSSFKNAEGAFDPDLYKQALARMGYTHAGFSQQLAGDLLLNQVHAGIASSAFATHSEFEELVALSFQKRDFSYVVLPIEKAKSKVIISDEEVAQQYKNNPGAYTSDDQVAVDYIDLNVADLMKDVSVSEEQIRKQYQQNLSTYKAQSEREAAHILIENNDPAKIKEVSAKLAAGEDFAALAKAYSDDAGSKEQGGELGFTKGDTFPAPFEQALSNLAVGEISVPVKTEAGTHFIKLVSERKAKAPGFEEQKAAIEDQLKRAEAENLFVAKLDELKDKAFNADSLGDVAAELGLKLQNTGLFSKPKGLGIAANKQVADAAFSDEVLKEGNSSDPIELDASRVVVLKKTDYQPAHLRTLDEVKDQIITELTEKKAGEQLLVAGQQLIAKLRAGESLEEEAKAGDFEYKSIASAQRSNSEVDTEILRFAFTMPKPNSAKSPTVDGFTASQGNFVVVSVGGVVAGTLVDAGDAEKHWGLMNQVASIFGNDEYSSFEELLKDKAKIEN